MGDRAGRWTADAVTVSRVPIAAAMVLARRRRNAVAGLFVLGVLTDVVDGWLARRLGTSSPRGARLDSAADAVFVAGSAAALAARLDEAARRRAIRVAATVAATRLATLLATRRRFGSWSVVHNHFNKMTGVALACLAAATLLRGRTPALAVAAVAALAEAAAIEELAIVLGSSDYDPDRTSFLGR